jgi:hypothetical protein
MLRYIEMKDLATTVFEDKEAIQNSKGDGRDGDEFHCRYHLTMIAQKSNPEFACPVGRRYKLDIARDRAFGDLYSKFRKLAVNSGCSPGGILLHP